MKASVAFRQIQNGPVGYIAKYYFDVHLNETSSFLLEQIVAEIKTGKTPSKAEAKFYTDADFDWFKPDEIGSGLYVDSAKSKVSKYAIASNQVTIFKPNTVLINCIGDIGRVSILRKEASANQQITGILFNDKVLPEYAFYYFLAHRELLESDASSTTLPIVNQKKLLSLPFKLIEVEEQQRIVDLLNHVWASSTSNFEPNISMFGFSESFNKEISKLIATDKSIKDISKELTQQQSYLQLLRQTILQEAVQGKLTHREPTDEPASALLARIKAEKAQLVKAGKLKKEKELPPITEAEIPFALPEGWVWCRLGEAVTKLTDGTHHSPPNISKGDFLYVTAKNIKTDGVQLDNISYVTKEVHDEIYSRCNPEKGDILYIKDGATTGIATINNLDIPFSMLSSVALIKVPTNICNDYLLFVLRSPFYYNSTRGEMAGIAITRVTLSKMATTLIPLPPYEEQIRIANTVKVLSKHIEGLESEATEQAIKSQLLLQTILKDAFQPQNKVYGTSETLSLAAEA